MKILKLILVLIIPFSLDAQIEVDIKAPELNLEAIYNKKDLTVPTIESLKGNIVVLDFWATWCSPCIAAFPENNILSNKYSGQNVRFIAITDDSPQKLENFLKKVKVDFWVGRDDDKQDFSNYKVLGRPQIYIINKDGYIVYHGNIVTEELIEEVIATNKVSLSEKNGSPNVIVNGGFSGGEDPLYNGMRNMLTDKTISHPVLIEHLIIRPSLQTTFGGFSYKITDDGHVGITYSGGSLPNIFQFLTGLSSTVWIKNNIKDSTLYDIIYWKKTMTYENAYSEIMHCLLNGLSIKFHSVSSEQMVNVLSLEKQNNFVKKESEIEDGTQKTYTPINEFVTQLENKSREYYVLDEMLQSAFIYNEGMDWKKLNSSNLNEIIDYLNSRGIKSEKKKRMITLYEINNKYQKD